MPYFNKPFITIYGIEDLCERVEKYCIPSLAMEPTEWKRNFGTEFKLVHIDIDSQRFKETEFQNYGMSIYDLPLFHLFVIKENEDNYVPQNKELFGKWIGTLRCRSIKNWNVLILCDNHKSKNKFTINKFSLLNRMKQDFNINNTEENFKKLEDTKDEIDQIQKHLRNTVLKYFGEKCYANEDNIQTQRAEAVSVKHWNYFNLFLLQEELADIYESLNLYDEALAQFEETNAVFSQFLFRYQKDRPNWIEEFRNVPLVKIDCFNFTNFSDPQKKKEIFDKCICLADFRSYLLSRQCVLFQMLNRFKEIPEKVYVTLLDFLNECRLLNLNIDPNLKNCWIYLTAKQALQRFSPTDCNDDIKQNYATLLRLALTSVNNMAENLNIWVNGKMDWSPVEKLRQSIVVLDNKEFGDTPSSQLCKAFKSQNLFREFHVKLYEETITIWKHVGRMRSAAHLGFQLADLYFNVSEYQKAEPLYLSAIKCFRKENWAHLAMPLRRKLAVCLKDQFKSNPNNTTVIRYLKTCVHLAGATFASAKETFFPNLSLRTSEEHKQFYKELSESISLWYDRSVVSDGNRRRSNSILSNDGSRGEKINKSVKQPYSLKLEPLFILDCIYLISNPEVGYQEVDLEFKSYLPVDIEAEVILHGMRHDEVDLYEQSTRSDELNVENYIQNNFDITSDEFVDIDSTDPPTYHRNNNSDDLRKMTHEIQVQKSIDENDEEDINVPEVISTLRKCPEHDADFEENDQIMKLVCLPKRDAGQSARKVSMSTETAIPISGFREEDDIEEGKTRFLCFNEESNMKSTTTIRTGINRIRLRSENPGFFIPDVLKLYMFDDKAVAWKHVTDDNLSPEWSDRNVMDKLLPNFIFDDSDKLVNINFDNVIQPKIKMGLLSFSREQLFVSVRVVNETSNDDLLYPGESSTDIKWTETTDQSDQIAQCNKEYSLSQALRYHYSDKSKQIQLCVSGVVRRGLYPINCRQLQIKPSITLAGNTRYFVSVELNTVLFEDTVESDSYYEFQLRKCSLNLHHADVPAVQLLDPINNFLTTGVFFNRSSYVMIWTLNSSDILNKDSYELKFTLNAELTMSEKDNNIDGNSRSNSNAVNLCGLIEHRFTLDYLSNR